MTVGTGTFSRRAKRWTIVIVVAALLASAGGWWALKQGRPWLYGLEAYMYGFPLVMMDLTKEAATAVPSAGEITAPINQFAVMTKYPDASFRAVVRTGLDTLFATAWADLDKEPLVLSVPDTNAAVDALQKQYKLTPLSAWGKPYEPSAEVPVAAGADAKALPLVAVSKMDAGTFFGRVARLMKDNPPAPADAPMVAKLKVLGIEPGKDFDIEKIDPDTARGLRRAMGAFEKLQEGVKKLKTNNGWIVIPKDFADYGTDYETRAGIALIGLGGIGGRTWCIRLLSLTVTTSRWMAPTVTFCISTRARRHPTTPPGRCRCTTRTATTCPTPSTVTISQRGCRSNATPTDHSTCSSRRTRQARTRKRTGCPRPQGGRSV